MKKSERVKEALKTLENMSKEEFKEFLIASGDTSFDESDEQLTYQNMPSHRVHPVQSYTVQIQDLKKTLVFMADGMRVELDPEYQRGYVWSEDQKERYVEHFFSSGMSGMDIYWNCPNWTHQGETEQDDTVIEILDGKQRLNAMLGYLDDKVKCYGKYCSEIGGHPRPFFSFTFHVLEFKTREQVVQWYLGMNNGGTVHTDDDLDVAREYMKSLKTS